jgi:amphi-Trp domain-containing protein
VSDDNEFKYESVQDVETITRYLDALADGFRKGELTFAREGEELVFKPCGLVGFNVEAKLKGSRRKVKLSFGWKERDQECENEDEFEIRSGSEA